MVWKLKDVTKIGPISINYIVLGCFFFGLLFSTTATTSSLSLQEEREQNIRNFATKVTVKVTSNQSQGSGFLFSCIAKKGVNYYTVVTNAHVVGNHSQFQVQVFDQSRYPAQLIERFDDPNTNDDLAILEFSSKQQYPIVKMPHPFSQPTSSEVVYAAGFPFLKQKFTFKQGEISKILPKPLEGGYQMGYYIDIEKGMSGGPLLNWRGEIIGVNGKHNYPLWGGPDEYYRDGSKIDESGDLIEQSSWAIPINIVIEKANSRLSSHKTISENSCLPLK